MASLIQQRMAITRRRTSGLLMIIIGGAFAVLGILELVVAEALRFSNWWVLAIAVFWAVAGIRERILGTRRLAAFEAEHGVGAGVQQPIRRR